MGKQRIKAEILKIPMTNENGNITHQNLKHEAKRNTEKDVHSNKCLKKQENIPNKQHTMTPKGIV